jgi:uncharacterized membrane protein
MASDDLVGDGGFGEVAVAAAERLTFFSDAVVAIAITLLAIDLPVPDGETSAELWDGLVAGSFEYLAFLISFLVIANHWTAHHRVFRWVRRADPPVVQLNLLWLLLVVVNPFLTRLITEGDLDFLRFSMYAAAQGLQMLAMAAMIMVLARRGWFAAGAPEWLTRRGWVRSVVGAAAFLVSVPLFPLLGRWAFAVWVLVPVVTGRVLARTGAITAR